MGSPAIEFVQFPAEFNVSRHVDDSLSGAERVCVLFEAYRQPHAHMMQGARGYKARRRA